MGGGRGEGGVAQLSLRRAHITNRNEVSLLTLTCKTKTKEKTSVKTRTIQTVGHILIQFYSKSRTHARTPRCSLIKYARKDKLYVPQTAMLLKQNHSERFGCLQGCNDVHLRTPATQTGGSSFLGVAKVPVCQSARQTEGRQPDCHPA